MPRVLASHTNFTARVSLGHHSQRFSTYLSTCATVLPIFTAVHDVVQYTTLHGGTQTINESLIYSTHPLLRLHRPKLAYDSASDKHQYSMYFQRKVGRSVAHPPIQISIPQSLRLHAPLTVMPTSPLQTFTFTAVAK